jgi:hypothetical protein
VYKLLDSRKHCWAARDFPGMIRCIIRNPSFVGHGTWYIMEEHFPEDKLLFTIKDGEIIL